MIANVLAGLIGLPHVYILVLEMFMWESPRGRKAFGLTPEFAAQTKVLAANQGLYNGFLATGGSGRCCSLAAKARWAGRWRFSSWAV